MEVVVGTDSTSALLAGGESQQLLVTDPSVSKGMAWKHYPWQLLHEIMINNPTAFVVFEGERFF
jgi:hypothetical protein